MGAEGTGQGGGGDDVNGGGDDQRRYGTEELFWHPRISDEIKGMRVPKEEGEEVEGLNVGYEN